MTSVAQRYSLWALNEDSRLDQFRRRMFSKLVLVSFSYRVSSSQNTGRPSLRPGNWCDRRAVVTY